MNVDDKLIAKLSDLTKLDFNADEKEAIKGDLDRMLVFVESLNEVDTEGVEPLIYVNPEVNVYRPDAVSESLDQKEALKNAPNHDSFYFKVPKVIDNPEQ